MIERRGRKQTGKTSGKGGMVRKLFGCFLHSRSDNERNEGPVGQVCLAKLPKTHLRCDLRSVSTAWRTWPVFLQAISSQTAQLDDICDTSATLAERRLNADTIDDGSTTEELQEHGQS